MTHTLLIIACIVGFYVCFIAFQVYKDLKAWFGSRRKSKLERIIECPLDILISGGQSIVRLFIRK